MKFQKKEIIFFNFKKILSEINVKLKNGDGKKVFSSLEEFEDEIKKENEREIFKKFLLLQRKITALAMILERLISMKSYLRLQIMLQIFLIKTGCCFLKGKMGK